VRAALARTIAEKGADLGLGAVGIAVLRPSAHAGALDRWLSTGFAGAMEWIGRTRLLRIDPWRRYPWARTAVVAAVSYLPYGGARRSQGGLARFVARNALGRDYHRALSDRLHALAGFIRREAPGAEARVHLDTGPILERELAARAGLGWFGKSTNLIRPRGDSWFLIGEILTDLDLPTAAPAADRCGTCTACLDACPTGAIVEPYLVDSNRCISYLTIEARGALPAHRHGAIGDWLFGCDICQEVCPWNRKAAPTGDGAFLPGPAILESDLAGVIGLDEPAFRARFRGTPLIRSRRQGLVRNAIIVAANTGDERALRAARDRLGDPDPVVRDTAALSLARAAGLRPDSRL
jgi:epoxyqueuosine reductase